eukprot:TRINITY_DN5144_c0_g1_i1.p1 TRINITY_DN5144_c0_g1~~TRINITY_DN5144_c0_g1_i1.p1  ORF type:complete len:176 (+),score=41.45 TRINITY_DN5144_c0_g1_i1:310-837(+)
MDNSATSKFKHGNRNYSPTHSDDGTVHNSLKSHNKHKGGAPRSRASRDPSSPRGGMPPGSQDREDQHRRTDATLAARISCDLKIAEEHKEGEDEEGCPICLMPASHPVILPDCCHRFCGACIRSWIGVGAGASGAAYLCPLCKKAFCTLVIIRPDGTKEEENLEPPAPTACNSKN